MKYSTKKTINKHLNVTHQQLDEAGSTSLRRPQTIESIQKHPIIECLIARGEKTADTCSSSP